MISTNFSAVPANLDQSYCMFNQQTLKMECQENINLRWVGQECANPVSIGRMKNAGHDGKCLSYGWEGGRDDAQDEVQLTMCGETLEQNIVLCDDGSLRSVADDSLCVTIPDDYYEFNMHGWFWPLPCEQMGGEIASYQKFEWVEESATEHTNGYTGNTWTAKWLKSKYRNECVVTYSGYWLYLTSCPTEEWRSEEDKTRALWYVVPTGTDA